MGVELHGYVLCEWWHEPVALEGKPVLFVLIEGRGSVQNLRFHVILAAKWIKMITGPLLCWFTYWIGIVASRRRIGDCLLGSLRLQTSASQMKEKETQRAKIEARTVHGPSIERDAAGRRESRSAASVMAWNVKWSTGSSSSSSTGVMANRRRCRLSFRSEFGTQLQADVMITAKTERHLVFKSHFRPAVRPGTNNNV